MNTIFTSPTYKLEKLNYIYIVLTAKNCNQRCKQCYIKFPLSRNTKDFIDINKIKEMLNDTKNEKLNCIYLTVQFIKQNHPQNHQLFSQKEWFLATILPW